MNEHFQIIKVYVLYYIANVHHIINGMTIG